eukprot:NODE_1399_length_1350_cov_86.160262_g1387_i0.p1 GENE.NODE_1399_length_1350_cov_86.160262_g1387_i0~~NODE_1399_length_1350_cov_86.160262_g1387_i0.p1  ORF type:complete len:356 (-),score=47.46 NODE_1399_length_1350_cov_86.160262_g1387_i0:162-1229(-)
MDSKFLLPISIVIAGFFFFLGSQAPGRQEGVQLQTEQRDDKQTQNTLTKNIPFGTTITIRPDPKVRGARPISDSGLGAPWHCPAWDNFPDPDYNRSVSYTYEYTGPFKFYDYTTRSNPVPLEPLGMEPWGWVNISCKNPETGAHKWRHKPDYLTVRKSLNSQHYLGSLVPIQEARRRVYIDLGANWYNTSIEGWFLDLYPQAETFEIEAFEMIPMYWKSFENHPEVKLVKAGVFYANKTLRAEDARMAHLVTRNTISMVNNKWKPKIRTLDFNEYMFRHFTKDDFVVVKMDIEGVEYDVLKRMVHTRAIDLIDELFVECHWKRWNGPFYYSRTWDTCIQLFTMLRDHGMYVHQWD